jgi:GNAT superfamily N-acetyltransferase
MCAELAVRSAAPADLCAVVDLLAQLAPGWVRQTSVTTPNEAEQIAWREILNTDRRITVVGELDDVVVGVADVLVVPALLDAVRPHGIVDALVVDADVRDRGIGKALMGEVHIRANAQGCCRMELLSSKGLDGAHAFYGALGYNPTAEGFRIDLPAKLA